MTRKRRFGVDAIRQEMTEQIKANGLRTMAREWGFSPAFVSEAVNGHAEITDKLARALGFEPVPREFTKRVSNESKKESHQF